MSLLSYLAHHPLRDRFDFSKTVLLGHSYGGATCISAVCKQEGSFRGAIALDGWFYPLSNEVRRQGCKVPLLMLSSQLWPSAKFQFPYREEVSRSSKTLSILGSHFDHKDDNYGSCGSDGSGKKIYPVLDLIIKGSNHQNFCDTHYIASQFLMSGGALLGKDNPKHLIEAIDGSIVGFMKYCILDDVDKKGILADPKQKLGLENFASLYYLSEEVIKSRKMSAKAIHQLLSYVRSISVDSEDLKNSQNIEVEDVDKKDNQSRNGDDKLVVCDYTYYDKTSTW